MSFPRDNGTSSNPASKKNTSLKAELAKRKTQEIQREIIQRQVQQARGVTSPGVDPKHTEPDAPPGFVQNHAPRSANSARSQFVVPPLADSSRITQAVVRVAGLNRQNGLRLKFLTHGQKRLAMGGAALILSMLVCAATLFIASNQPMNAQPNLPPLPIVTANDVLAYLKKAQVPITSAHELALTGEAWLANAEIQLDLRQGDALGTFLILSYSSSQAMMLDTFRVGTSAKFKHWKVMSESNVIILASPETAQSLRDEIGIHLTQYLAAPYRPYLPTAMP